ncbi:uncharacterized protein BT62DRAFT_916705 [Guyanagaster necrorhizus]|uniref:Uncharacterized protein n=1 Tax=Guyanagaster necrorhizus TaxID=856835 RepID=A0A9P8AW52_9AGAR|nr:uncharacterized protein BT62DRAFT_916705 [Guyanagaster necrorhizus MCA 3950]KAG7450213.1 hypothetical protein BT62DRAFT_916705 [Guyanagaster necrorhizus MCA 3950]
MRENTLFGRYLQAQAAEEQRRNTKSNRTSMLIGTTTNSISNSPFQKPTTLTAEPDPWAGPPEGVIHMNERLTIFSSKEMEYQQTEKLSEEMMRALTSQFYQNFHWYCRAMVAVAVSSMAVPEVYDPCDSSLLEEDASSKTTSGDTDDKKEEDHDERVEDPLTDWVSSWNIHMLEEKQKELAWETCQKDFIELYQNGTTILWMDDT